MNKTKQLLSSLIILFSSLNMHSLTGEDDHQPSADGIELNGNYDIFIEPSTCFLSPGSAQALILLSGKYYVRREFDSKNDQVTLRSVQSPDDISNSYQHPFGFKFIRGESFDFFGFDNDDLQSSIQKFLEDQGDQFDVILQATNSIDQSDEQTFVEGVLMNLVTKATGFFFLENQKIFDKISERRIKGMQDNYLIYFDYENNYEDAKKEFENLSGSIYTIKNGKITKK